MKIIRNAKGESDLKSQESRPYEICNSEHLTECFCDCGVVIIRRIDHKSWDELGNMGTNYYSPTMLTELANSVVLTGLNWKYGD